MSNEAILANENSYVGRVRRYAQVSGTVGGIAARMAGQRVFGLTVDKDRQASELREALGGLKGPLMKVAQMLATIPDALPAEYAAELAQLQSSAPPMGPSFVRRRMKTELGPDWQSRFDHFPMEAAAAASLGQVHKAAKDGQTLACKLQYPNISAAVEADLNQLSIILALYRRYDSTIDTSKIAEEVSERLREELDYAREAKNIRLYSRMLADEPHVHVPDVIGDLSTGRLLTMSWLEGRKLLDVKEEPVEARNEIALNMFRAWYTPFYYYGVIHGDPHLGNYTIRDDNTVNLLDFGCIRVFPPTFVEGVIELFWALLNDEHERAVHAYRLWGFDKLSKELIEVLNIWARFIYGPLLEDRVRRIQETNSGALGRQVAEKTHAELRRVGGVQVPREFVFMDRAAIGLGAVFMHLNAEINWHRVFLDMIDTFDVEQLSQRQHDGLVQVGLA